MALSATTLSAPCAASDAKITVASASGFAVGQPVLVENELMAQTAAAVGLVIPVRRGLDGTVQGAHASGGYVATGLGSDFPGPAPGQEVVYSPAAPDGMQAGWSYFTYSIAGAIPVISGVHTINGSGATAMTIGAPTAAQEGAELTVISKNLHANTPCDARLSRRGGRDGDVCGDRRQHELKVVGGSWPSSRRRRGVHLRRQRWPITRFDRSRQRDGALEQADRYQEWPKMLYRAATTTGR